MPTSKLRRLKNAQFRDLEPGTELRFADGIRFLVGDRHPGETTLSTLRSRVCRGSFMLEPTDEPFDLAEDRLTDSVFQRPLAASELDRGSGLAGALDARDLTTAAAFHDFEFGAGGLRYDVRGSTFTITRRDGRVVAHDEQRLLGSSDYLACNLEPCGRLRRRAAHRPVRAAARRLFRHARRPPRRPRLPRSGASPAAPRARMLD
ncbi:hypothetical protein [Nannocystis pusilla]|uniref:hypothetical protein n=1 Tax=Nannocystis pusilla TaxID=889268 RepID=UPI003DA44335